MLSKARYYASILLLLMCALLAVSFAQNQNVMPDKFSGKWTEYYESGDRKSETIFKEGKKTGLSIYWYQSGCPMSMHHFESDALNGPMIKWEKCEGIIAIGEYQNNEPWNGYFLVNPATAIPIITTTVYESGLTYYVAKYTNGKLFSSLSEKTLDGFMIANPMYNKLLNRLGVKQESAPTFKVPN